MLAETFLTARSITHIFAPVFVTVADAFSIMPANIDVTWIMRNTANVIPMSGAPNLPLSFTKSL